MIKVEENYATEFYYLSLLWRHDHLKVQPYYAFLCGQYVQEIDRFYRHFIPQFAELQYCNDGQNKHL